MPIDHIGGLSAFPDFGMHAAEADWLTQRFPLTDEQVRRELLREPCAFPEGFRPENYRVFRGAPARLLSDGEETDAGGRRLIALHTPGHSPGHLCFFEPDRGYLYSGDLLYRGCLDAFYPSTDPQAFLASLRRLLTLEKQIRRFYRGIATARCRADFCGGSRRRFPAWTRGGCCGTEAGGTISAIFPSVCKSAETGRQSGRPPMRVATCPEEKSRSAGFGEKK